MILQQLDGLMIANLKISLESAGVSKLAYRIGEYGEEAVCLERKDNGWIVYTGERGKQNRVVRFALVRDACIEVLKRTIPDKEEQDRRIKAFSDATKKSNKAVQVTDIVSDYKLEVVRVGEQGESAQIKLRSMNAD